MLILICPQVASRNFVLLKGRPLFGIRSTVTPSIRAWQEVARSLSSSGGKWKAGGQEEPDWPFAEDKVAAMAFGPDDGEEVVYELSESLDVVNVVVDSAPGWTTVVSLGAREHPNRAFGPEADGGRQELFFETPVKVDLCCAKPPREEEHDLLLLSRVNFRPVEEVSPPHDDDDVTRLVESYLSRRRAFRMSGEAEGTGRSLSLDEALRLGATWRWVGLGRKEKVASAAATAPEEISEAIREKKVPPGLRWAEAATMDDDDDDEIVAIIPKFVRERSSPLMVTTGRRLRLYPAGRGGLLNGNLWRGRTLWARIIVI